MVRQTFIICGGCGGTGAAARNFGCVASAVPTTAKAVRAMQHA